MLRLSFAAPFVPAITWALAPAVVAHSFRFLIENRLPEKRAFASGLANAVVTIGLLAPILLILHQLAQQSMAGVTKLQRVIDSGAILQTLEIDSRMAASYRRVENNLDPKKKWQAWRPGSAKMWAHGSKAQFGRRSI